MSMRIKAIAISQGATQVAMKSKAGPFPWLLVAVTLLWMQGASAAAQSGDAAAELALRQQIAERVDAIAGDPEARKKAVKQGRERAILCSYCHGMDGNGLRPEIPKLSGQNPVYLLDQFEKFATGERKERVMQELAASFTEEDKVKIVLYYSSVEMIPAGGDETLAPAGEAVYTTHCVSCHGPDGKGQEGYARLAGQSPLYVEKMLKEFRDRTTGNRFNPFMTAVSLRLTDDDMKAVAAYIANLR